jgi:FixJ family two-component response regulator
LFGTEKIMIVDDEKYIRNSTIGLLEEMALMVRQLLDKNQIP